MTLEEALLELERVTAERDDEIRAADHLAKEFAIKERALTDYFADASRRAEAAEEDNEQLRAAINKWYPRLAGTAIGERQLGHNESAERWEELCRDFHAALGVSAHTQDKP